MFPIDMALATDLAKCHGVMAVSGSPGSQVGTWDGMTCVSGPGGGCDLRYVEYGRYDKAWGTSKSSTNLVPTDIKHVILDL